MCHGEFKLISKCRLPIDNGTRKSLGGTKAPAMDGAVGLWGCEAMGLDTEVMRGEGEGCKINFPR